MSWLRNLIAILLLLPSVVSVSQLPTGSISGTVILGKEGSPVSGAEVTLLRFEGSRSSIGKTISNSSGDFSFVNVPAGSVTVAVSHPGMVRVDRTPERILATIRPQEEVKGYVAAMARESIIEGRVNDLEGKPSFGATLRTYNLEGEGRRTIGRVDENGNFKFVVEPGKFILSADYDPAETDTIKTYYPGVSDRKGALTLELAEGETKSNIEFRMLPAANVKVSGFVLDRYRTSGEPSGRAYLEAVAAGHNHRYPHRGFYPTPGPGL